ncbi:MAG: hypothetical protein ACKO7Z_10575 [Cyanobacteriota bacterium]
MRSAADHDRAAQPDATVSVPGHEREKAAILRWNAPVQPLS